MADQEKPKPVLEKPPGYRDPRAPRAARPLTMRKPPPGRGIYRPKRRRRSCFRRCCCFIFVVLFCLLILAAIVGALFYVWYKPKLPSFSIESAETPRFRVSVRGDGTYLDSETVVRVRAKNPNSKLGFSYGRMGVRIKTDEEGVSLGSGSVAGFEQEAGAWRVLKVSMSVKNRMIDDEVGTRVKSEFQSKQLSLAVDVRTSLGVKVGSLRIGKMPVRVQCKDVMLKKKNGKGSSPKCHVILFRWMKIS